MNWTHKPHYRIALRILAAPWICFLVFTIGPWVKNFIKYGEGHNYFMAVFSALIIIAGAHMIFEAGRFMLDLKKESK